MKTSRNRWGWVAVVVAVLFCGLVPCYGANPWLVTPDGTGDGSVWSTPASLTNALASAASGDTLWLAQGTYSNSTTFAVAMNLTLYGGFTNGMDTLGERDWTAYPTILDGKKQNLRVVTITGTNVTLDGLIISNSYGTAAGGISKTTSGALTLANCRIVGHEGRAADMKGIGVYVTSGSVLMTNSVVGMNTISGTSAYQGLGFGIYSKGANLQVVDCSISDHYGVMRDTRSAKGVGLYFDQGNLQVLRTMFTNNAAGANNGGGGSAVYLGNNATFSAVFSNCLFRGNAALGVEGGASAGAAVWAQVNSAKTATFVNCTFAYNTNYNGNGGAFHVSSGTVEVRNSLLWKNGVAAGYSGNEIYVAGGTLRASYSGITGTVLPYVLALGSGSVVLSNIMTNDPLFASTADLHLKSPAGRWQNGSWVTTDTVYSPAIDAGDPADSVGAEPAGNNGGRVNLGAYGGTEQASKSPANAPVVVNRTVSTNVNVAIVRGELIDNDAIASVTIYYGTSPTVTNTSTALAFYPMQQTGTVFEARLTGLLYDTDYYFRCYATNAYGEDWADTTETFHTGAKPSGGPDGVIHVKADAAGGETGDCWFNAYKSLAQAAASVTAGTNELWVAGGTYGDGTVAIGAMCSIYGGFAGTETIRGDRNVAANPVLIDGLGVRRGVSITAGTILLDGLIVTNGYMTTSGSGINASGTYGLTLRDCQVLSCRPSGDGVKGIGAYFNSGAVAMSNCVFRDNRFAVVGGYASSQGSGFYANNANVQILDSRFESNGWEAWETRSSAGGAFYQTGGTLAVTNTTFIGNAIGSDLYGGCGVINGGATARFMNSVFRGNRVFYRSDRDGVGGALYVADASTSVTVENCTLSANYGAKRGGAIYVAAGSVTVKNCILWTNTCANFFAGSEGYDAVCAGGTLTMSYCNLSGSKDSSTYLYDSSGGGLVKGSGLATADPLFAGATDVHLKSKAGRWYPTLNGGAGDWTTDAVSSPCIDAGDPASAWANEPTPNGSRVNLGAYGNTWQASKSFLVAPVVTNRTPTVTYNYATLRGELVDVDATAEIRIYYGFSDGNWIGYVQPSPASQQTGTVFTASVGDLLYSTDYYYRCFATNAAGSDWADNLMSFTTGVEPPGGPDSVIHVRADAAGSQSGVTWFDACLTLAAGVARVNGATNEIWVAAGSELVASTVPIATNVSIYGGFLGGAADGETSRSQRSLTNATALNGNNERRVMRITSGAVLLDGLTFTNGLAMDPTSGPFGDPLYRGSGLYASGGGNLTLANCVFADNGGLDQRSGSGAYFEGGAVQMTNCLFAGNGLYGAALGWNYSLQGSGFYGSGAAITASDCLFEDNGTTGYFGRSGKGGAFFLNGGSLSATNCVFANNKTGTDSGYGGGGGAVEGTATARFVNCVFRGNSGSYDPANASRGGADGGVFRIAGTSATTVTVANCSLAYNTAGGTGGVAWVSGGTLVLTNSILWSNQTAQAGAMGTELAALGANSRVSAAYTDFTGTNSPYIVNVDGNATISLGAGILTVDPLFASTNDLHLRSRFGRWDPALNAGAGAWTNDLVTSPCIDAGDGVWINEPEWNGRKVNLGAYGNTWQASKGPWPSGTMFIIR